MLPRSWRGRKTGRAGRVGGGSRPSQRALLQGGTQMSIVEEDTLLLWMWRLGHFCAETISDGLK